uniref:WAP domain-containing protein n=1 Tax=Rhabditophanes sp. KR3021 TaxID=114890 RepID=A0AC35TVG5_9BILA
MQFLVVLLLNIWILVVLATNNGDIDIEIRDTKNDVVVRGNRHFLRRTYSLTRLVCGKDKHCNPSFGCCSDQRGKLDCCEKEIVLTIPHN